MCPLHANKYTLVMWQLLYFWTKWLQSKLVSIRKTVKENNLILSSFILAPDEIIVLTHPSCDGEMAINETS